MAFVGKFLMGISVAVLVLIIGIMFSSAFVEFDDWDGLAQTLGPLGVMLVEALQNILTFVIDFFSLILDFIRDVFNF